MAATETDKTRWRALDLDQLLVEHLDDEWLIFDRRSGQTHLLPDMAAQALFIFCREPQGLRGLIRLLERLYDDAPLEQDARATIGTLVDQFFELGWVEEVDE